MNLEKVKELEKILDKYNNEEKNQYWYDNLSDDEEVEFPNEYVFVSQSKKTQKTVYNEIVKAFGKDNFLFMITWLKQHEVCINLDGLN